MANAVKFAELLTEGILAVKDAESHDNRKLVRDIEQELGEALNRQRSTIEWFRKGNIPATHRDVEQLAFELFKRGGLPESRAENFLRAAGHPDVEGVLDELRHQAPSSQLLEQMTYKYNLIDFVHEYSKDARVTSIKKKDVEVVGTEPVSAISQVTRSSSVDELRQKFDLEMIESSREGSGEVRSITRVNNPYSTVWLVEFDPPLRPGEKATYVYRQTIQYESLVSYEKCLKSYKAGYRHGNFVSWRLRVHRPVDVVRYRVKLPPGYNLTLPSTGGYSVYAGYVEDLKEKTRLQSESAFSAKITSAGWVLDLKFSNGIAGRVYEIHWIPPTEAELAVLTG